MPLVFSNVGETVTVKSIRGDDELKMFVQKLGMVPGTELTVAANRGGDLIVTVKDVRIAVTRDVAMRIIV